MALNYTCGSFRFPAGSTSAQGWQNRLTSTFRFLLPTAENRRIRKIGVYCYWQAEFTTSSNSESIQMPWYNCVIMPTSNDDFYRSQPARTPDPITVGGLGAPVFIGGSQELILQATHHQPMIDVDFEGNGIRIIKFGYYHPAGAPTNTAQMEIAIVIGWENIC